ncbi:DUF4255 domain-containing protein [Veronia pacifica]|uniref:Pvc16 N-terminal domain-containing protein n=1 Tax=Veronia pacifica TaxID=1080227 RepID=A0A1C3EEE1_9GAMM|nr:DUF4255 domain-containing protein [Veronia pacifica]ODA31589.1 hypothetical protein A8L45_16420 [Veronia pacifica]
MSTALAIAGVTQLLRDLLNDGLVDNDVACVVNTNVPVHALPPDRMLAEEDNNGPALNVFLYHTEVNGGLANQILPTRNQQGDRVNNTPLPLDLFYIVSAYGSADLHNDVLLGYAMQILHEHPGFTRAEIQTALNPSPAIAAGLPPLLQALADTGLAEQAEAIRIAPHQMPVAEKSALWSALQSQYRPSAIYRVSTVLIQAQYPVRNVLPVLTLGADNDGPAVQPSVMSPFPTLARAILPALQASVRLGDTLDVEGIGLDGANPRFTFSHLSQAINHTVNAQAGGNARAQSVAIPTLSSDWAAGIYSVMFSVDVSGDPVHSNKLSIPFAPVMTLPPNSVVRNDQTVVVTVQVTPHVYPGQQAMMWLGAEGAIAESVPTASNTLVFIFGPLAAGSYPARMRIDGVDSWFILRDRPPVAPGFTSRAPVYDPTQVVVVPS